MQAFLRKIVEKDKAIHDRITKQFPKTVRIIDMVFGAFLNIVSNPLFAIILTLVLVPLVTSEAISLVNALSIGGAWIIAVAWLARSSPLKDFPVPSRFLVVMCLSVVLATGGMALGRWSTKKWEKHHKTSEPKTSPSPEPMPTEAKKEPPKDTTKPEPPPLEKSPVHAIRKPPVSAEEMAAALEGDLLGGDEEITDGKQRVAPWVEIADSGSVQIMLPPKQGESPQPYYKPFPDAEFRTEYGKKGPMVSTTIRDAEGHIVAVVEKNHWTVYQPFCTDKNYTQDSLEILDSSWHVVLQLRILPDRVRVQGEWWDNLGHGLRIVKDSQGRALAIRLGPRMKNNELLIKPIFKHPSKHHWGEFIQ